MKEKHRFATRETAGGCWLRLYVYLYLFNPALFILQSMRHWMCVGAVLPTAALMRRALIGIGFGERRHLRLVLLHGIGSGEMLYELFQHLHRSGRTIEQLVVMDVNARFIERSKRLLDCLRRCYPHVELAVRFELTDAYNTPAFLSASGLPKADLIIGTLPYSNMPQCIDDWLAMYASTSAAFGYCSYASWTKRPSARVATRMMFESLASQFGRVHRSKLIWANVPPGYAVLGDNL
jgi:hypothetical protein